MKYSVRIVMLLLVLFASSACSGKTETDRNLSGTLKILYSDESYFHNEYGQFFSKIYPNVEFEIISLDERYQFLAANGFDHGKFLETYEPDILLIDSLQQYAELAETGVLVDLEALIQADSYDIGSLNDNVMEFLRKPVGGGLYALAPRFDNLALYYNIDLFNEHGVEPPRDGMTWEEVLELAARFPADGDPKERIAGFSDRSDLSSLVIQMAEAEGLGLYTGLDRELAFRSDSWRAIIEKVVEAGQSGVLYVPGVSEITDFNPPGTVQTNLFIAGRSAMTVDYFRLTEEIREMRDKLGSSFNYGVVTAPIGRSSGAGGGTVLLSDIFGINANSPRQSRRRRLRKAPVRIIGASARPLLVHEGERRRKPRAVLQVQGESGCEGAARRALSGVQRLPFRADPGVAQGRRRRAVDRRDDRGDRAGDGRGRVADSALNKTMRDGSGMQPVAIPL